MSEEISLIEARERRVERVRNLTLMSDVFMSVALNDIPACQYVLRILTGIKTLKVKEVRTQAKISKTASRDAVLDVLAEDETGRLYDLEIQQLDTVDHARRTRFYSAMIDSSYLEKGKTYADLPEVYVIYVSKTDIWKKGRTTYLVEKYFKDTDTVYDDGQHVLYVNAAVDDGSETAKLMQYFKTSNPDNMEHGELSKRVHYLKREEGGTRKCVKLRKKSSMRAKQRAAQKKKERPLLVFSKWVCPLKKSRKLSESVLSLCRNGFPVAELPVRQNNHLDQEVRTYVYPGFLRLRLRAVRNMKMLKKV